MKKIIVSLLATILVWPHIAVFAQENVPNDPTSSMTIELGAPVTDGEDSNNQDVEGDPNFVPPELPVTDGPVNSNYEGPIGVTGIFNGNVSTGCSYDPVSHSAHRTIDDIVVAGSIGKYPLKMTRYYNSRQQYYASGAIGLSPGWAHEYSWLQGSGYIPKLISPQGNVNDAFCGPPVGVSEAWEGNDWRLADGGRVHFDTSAHPAYIEDPYGQRTIITLDGNERVWKVTEPGGRYLQFFYGPAADPDGTVLLTRVEAHGLGNATVTDWVNYSYSLVSAGVQGRNKMMLTRVDYPDSNPNNLNDNTHAHYVYRPDNVTENQTTHKMYPLLQRCDDVRYNGAMRTIRYEYQNEYPHGFVINEKYPDVGAVSSITPNGPDTFTETRGDGPTRSFTYTHLMHCHGPECGPCDDYENNNPPQQMLTSYTDFQGHTTTLGYDPHWYINSVRDANNHTTTYERGPPPPTGIGEIKKITHPDATYIQYIYGSDPHYVMSIRDERGNWTVHTRDANHRVISTDYKDSQNQVLAHEEFVYNSFGQVTRHKLKNGNYVHYQYNTRGLLTAKWNPTPNDTAVSGDPKITYSYWNNAVWADRLYQETLPANVSNQTASKRFEYDRDASGNAAPGRGLVTKITHANGKYQSFGYSQFGNKLWEENELRQRTTYTYDNYNRVLSVKNPLNKFEYFDYLKPGTASPYLHTSDSVYTHTSRAEIVTRNVYDQNWRKTSSTAASGTLNLTTRFAYDNVGNLKDVTDPRSKITHNDYDNRNRKTSSTEAYNTTLAATTVWRYDAASNINQIGRPDGIHEAKGYDALNRVIWNSVPRQVVGGGQVNVTMHFYYNPSGTLQQVTDPNGRPTTFLYDPSDRKTKMTYPGGSYQEWAYDDASNLKSRTTVSGKIQSFQYDILNRKIGMSWSSGADSAMYGYDDASRLTNINNPNSSVTRTYDAAGRLTQEQQNVVGLGIKTVSYPLHDDEGRLKQISAAGIYDYTFGYDAAGRFKTISTGGSVKFEYDYDAASNETHRYAYFNGVTIDQIYNRDSLNRMASRVLKRNTSTFSTEAYTYDHMNRITRVSRGDLTDRFNYYWTGELLSAQYGGESEFPYTEEQEPDLDTTDTLDPNAGYQPPETAEAEPTPPPDDAPPSDPIANSAPAPDVTPSDTPPAEDPAKGQKTVDDYVGDSNLGPEGPGQPDLPTGRNVTYTLDKAGNRTSVTDDANGNATYSPNNLNQYTWVGGHQVINGGEHEIQTYKSITYTYINDEHLKTVTGGGNTYNLYYDALGRCVKRSLNGTITYYIYDGEKPILEYRSGNLNNPARNVYGKGIDEILMRYDPTLTQNQTFYYQQDHEGSVTHLLNTSGNVIETYRYDVFGEPGIYEADGVTLRSASIVSNRFLFTGREYANLFGFYEYRARVYHPGLGRFMSEDSKLFVRRAGLGAPPADWTFAAHPDEAEFNLFRYCGNDPANYVDPTGEFVDTLIDVGFIAYDLYKVATDSGNRGTQLRALGLDVVGAAVPFATGLGPAYRAGKALEHGAEAVRGTQEGTKVVQRAMSKAELAETQKTHLLRGGRDGTHYVSDAVNSEAGRARQRLALPQKPEVRATLEVPADRLSDPSRVVPNNNMPGGGMERTASGSVPARVIRVDKYRQ